MIGVYFISFFIASIAGVISLIILGRLFKTKKFIDVLLILSISALVSIITFFASNKIILYVILNPKVDTKFMTEDFKDYVLNINNLIDWKEYDKISINKYTIDYYNTNAGYKPIKTETNNINIKDIFEKTPINNITLNYNEQILSTIYLYSRKTNFDYVYEKNHKYKKGKILSGLRGRVAKVIDENWYVLMPCDRTVCP